MHACGHDVHMAIALELTRAMAERRAQLSGMVRFVFQPAEERGLGAKPMIEAGVLDGIDRVIGLHVWSELPVGQVSVRPGAMMAGSDMFTLTIRGAGGHGAQPQYTVDAVVIAAQVVSAIQTLASRESAPAAPVVITLGSIHGGSAANIVAMFLIMHAWGKDQHTGHKIRMLADGSADYTKALGLPMDLTARGMGMRMQRFSMLVDNGVVKALNVEAPGKFEVSDAETMLKQLG